MWICRFFISVVWQQWAMLYKNLWKYVEFSEQKILYPWDLVMIIKCSTVSLSGLTNIRRGSWAETRPGSSAASNQLVWSLGVSGVSSESCVSSLNTGVNLSYSVSTAPPPHTSLAVRGMMWSAHWEPGLTDRNLDLWWLRRECWRSPTCSSVWTAGREHWDTPAPAPAPTLAAPVSSYTISSVSLTTARSSQTPAPLSSPGSSASTWGIWRLESGTWLSYCCSILDW